MLTSQMYIKGQSLNQKDSIFRSLGEGRDREALSVDFKPIPDSRIGELAASFDIVLGKTPEDRT